jgi:hypothetical protein
MACVLVIGALLCGHATGSARKLAVAQRFVAAKLPELRMNTELVCSGDEAVITRFETLAGGVGAAS